MENLGNFMLFGNSILIIQLVLFVFFAYSQYLLSKKLRVESSYMAFIPVFSTINLIRMSGGRWYEIFIAFIPFYNLFWYIRYILHPISIKTGHGAGWTAGLFFLPIIFLLITAFSYRSAEGSVAERGEQQVFREKKVAAGIGSAFLLIIPIISILGMGPLGSAQHRALDTEKIAHLSAIKTLLEVEMMDTGSYPKTPASECAYDIEFATPPLRPLMTDKEGLGAGGCSDSVAYKLLPSGNAVLATRVTNKTRANFDGSRWENISRDDLTESVITRGNTSQEKEYWYYIVPVFK